MFSADQVRVYSRVRAGAATILQGVSLFALVLFAFASFLPLSNEPASGDSFSAASVVAAATFVFAQRGSGRLEGWIAVVAACAMCASVTLSTNLDERVDIGVKVCNLMAAVTTVLLGLRQSRLPLVRLTIEQEMERDLMIVRWIGTGIAVVVLGVLVTAGVTLSMSGSHI